MKHKKISGEVNESHLSADRVADLLGVPMRMPVMAFHCPTVFGSSETLRKTFHAKAMAVILLRRRSELAPTKSSRRSVFASFSTPS